MKTDLLCNDFGQVAFALLHSYFCYSGKSGFNISCGMNRFFLQAVPTLFFLECSSFFRG